MNFRHLMILLLEPLASPEVVAEYEAGLDKRRFL
jgi:hypothetical protein